LSRIEQKKGKLTIIAEVGSNYNNDLELAKQYIRASYEKGANAVKFQTIRKDLLVSPKILSDGKLRTNPVYENFKNLELPDPWHHELKKEADKYGIEFLCTPFYLEAVDLLEAVGVQTYKIASGDITFHPLLDRVGMTGKKVLLSTGASNLKDIERAVNRLQKSGANNIVLLHCVSNYPPEWNEMNLRAMVTLQRNFGFPVGISDHSPGFLVPIAAVTLGATYIEKHVTLDRSLPGPDHAFAATIEEFGQMVKYVRLLKPALGNGEKLPSETEDAKQRLLRRGVYDPKTLEPVEGQEGIWLRPEHSSKDKSS
jgi:sialic acid synthase SpsE